MEFQTPSLASGSLNCVTLKRAVHGDIKHKKMKKMKIKMKKNEDYDEDV